MTSDIARHGMSIMLSREDMGFIGSIESDCATLNKMLESIYDLDVKFCRDATRGGLAAVLNEIAEASNLSFIINEKDVPIRDDVKSFCNILGFDPLNVANEGVAVIIASNQDAENILKRVQQFDTGKKSAIIGEVCSDVTNSQKVVINTMIGGKRYVEMPQGELLPRIC